MTKQSLCRYCLFSVIPAEAGIHVSQSCHPATPSTQSTDEAISMPFPSPPVSFPCKRESRWGCGCALNPCPPLPPCAIPHLMRDQLKKRHPRVFFTCQN